jgi:outer membrane receptor protein involved in Fe transport
VEPLEYPTSGFTTAYVRGYITPTPNLHIIGGIDNLFDRSYVEHLNLRLAPQGPNVATPVLSPGITPYLAVEWRL